MTFLVGSDLLGQNHALVTPPVTIDLFPVTGLGGGEVRAKYIEALCPPPGELCDQRAFLLLVLNTLMFSCVFGIMTQGMPPEDPASVTPSLQH
jgi:hypothetical protein